MERRVQSPNSLLCLFVGLILIGCVSQPDEIMMHDPEVSKEKGIVCYQGSPYSGKIMEYDSTGYLAAEMEFKHGQKQGRSIYYWPNSQVKRDAMYEAGVYHGPVIQYYENGRLFSKFNYDHGHEKGLQQMWKSDGRLKANYEVINGRKYGLTGVKNCVNVWEDSLTFH